MSRANKKSTGSGILNVSLEAGSSQIMLHEIRLTLSNDSAKVNFFTITLDSAKGSEYDNLIMKHDMQDVKDLNCTFDDKRFVPGDTLLFTWPNSDSVTWGLEIIYESFC